MTIPPSTDPQQAAVHESKSLRPLGAASSRDFENHIRRVMPAVNLFVVALALVSFMTADRVWDQNANFITFATVVSVVLVMTVIMPPIMRSVNRPLFKALDADSLSDEELLKA